MEVLITLTFTNNTSYRNKISSDDKSLDEIVDDVSNIFKSNKISKIVFDSSTALIVRPSTITSITFDVISDLTSDELLEDEEEDGCENPYEFEDDREEELKETLGDDDVVDDDD